MWAVLSHVNSSQRHGSARGNTLHLLGATWPQLFSLCALPTGSCVKPLPASKPASHSLLFSCFAFLFFFFFFFFFFFLSLAWRGGKFFQTETPSFYNSDSSRPHPSILFPHSTRVRLGSRQTALISQQHNNTEPWPPRPALLLLWQSRSCSCLLQTFLKL